MICIKKLNSRRGAAVIIALLVSFIAALSGTVALVMSSSNAGRAGYNKEEQQAYLSIASAAQLISDTFKNLTATVKEEGGNYSSVTYSGGEETLFLADERFKKDLYLAAKQSAVEEGYFDKICFTLNLNEDVVYVDLNMKGVRTSNVGLVFELSVKNYRPYYMRVKCHIPENLSDGEVKITFGDATFEAQGGTGSAGGGD